jgi:hypothetical protein
MKVSADGVRRRPALRPAFEDLVAEKQRPEERYRDQCNGAPGIAALRRRLLSTATG